MPALAHDDEGPWVPDPWDGQPDCLPQWWLLAAGDGLMPTTDQMTAFRDAHRRVTGFRGTRLTPAGAAFVRTAVRDSLYAAPQPVTHHWVAYSLTVLSALVRMCETAGIPLTRQRVFTERTRQRFLHVQCAGFVDMSRAGYRSRLDVITEALRNAPQDPFVNRPTISADDVLDPYTEKQEIALVAWSASIRPETRHDRVRAVLALGAGCGQRRRDMVVTRGTDVTRDADGVHVQIGGTLPRTVTCLAVYEGMLWRAAERAGDNLLVSPWSQTLSEDTLTGGLNSVNAQRPPVPVMIRRLRNTWLAHHLVSGTPLRVLLPAAGLGGLAHIQDLLPHLPAPDNCSAALRKAGA